MEEENRELELQEESLQPQIQTEQEHTKEKKRGTLRTLLFGILIGLLISQIVILVMSRVVGLTGIGQLAVIGQKIQKKPTTVLTKDVKNKIKLIESNIAQNYLFDVTDEQLADGLYEGLVEATGDRYADYYTKEDIQKLQESTTGVFYGIGAYVGLDQATGYPKLTGIMEGTPAEKAGLKAEDVIVEVDGQDVRGYELSDAVALIKGEEGTKVLLTIYREGQTDYMKVEVTRARVESPTVTYEKKEDGIAYIRIMQFESVTSQQFAEKLQQARDEGMKGLILDLRSNPGGTLDSVVKIARMLLPEGMIVYTEDKYGKRNEYKCNGENEFDLPLVVLINENSASAAEILSGAIKDYGLGTLVGKTTYGKGIVQKVFYMTDNTALKLTISHYYTPKGNDIHEVGIEPDIEADLDVEKYLDEDVDTQYDEALKQLKKQMK